MKTYISGPITGVPDYNRTAFATAAKSLLAQGRAVFNPTENGLPESATWEEHMRADIKALMDCDVIHMPPSPTRWKERSRTYEGVAHAMAAQWSPLLQHNPTVNRR